MADDARGQAASSSRSRLQVAVSRAALRKRRRTGASGVALRLKCSADMTVNAAAPPVGTIHARANTRVHPSSFSGGHVTSAHRAHHHVDAFSYTAKMAIDADGGHSRLAHSDPYYQRDTSLHLGGRPLDSDKIPFVVLPPRCSDVSR